MSRVNGGDGSRSGEMTALMATTGESTLIANLSSHLDQEEIVVVTSQPAAGGTSLQTTVTAGKLRRDGDFSTRIRAVTRHHRHGNRS